MEKKININRFLDDSGKIMLLPQKQNMRYALLEYLAEKFESERKYEEQEVNDICNQWHTFGDLFVLRRELVDHGLLCRKLDGSKYWRTKSDLNS